jgi:predicted nucleic acid-binding protein
MKLMKDKFFFDTNVLIYLLSDEYERHNKASELYKSINRKVISTQVINEFANVCYKKNLLKTDISLYIEKLSLNFEVGLIYKTTILKSIHIKEKYGFSYYDSVIIASALQNDCIILYTEDMKHQQVIENTLTILNPFI